MKRNPPVPLSEELWGDRWQFASLTAGDFWDYFSGRPIPVHSLPELWQPLILGLASDLFIPGIAIMGGRKALTIARWIDATDPRAIIYSPGLPDGVILHSGEVDRHILATFEDEQMRAAGELFTERKIAAKGLHFLLIQPDDSGMTQSGVWLMREEGR
jgi:RNA-binding protein Tab2/Atab2